MMKHNVHAEVSRILEDNEWEPSQSSKRWVKFGQFYEYEKVPDIEYSISNNLIKQIVHYNELTKDINLKNTYSGRKKAIIKIYIAYVPKTREYYIGYTTRSIIRSIKSILHRYLMGEVTMLDNFSNIHKVKVKLVKCLKGVPDRLLMNAIINELVGFSRSIIK
jgi:hypothetical protein